MANLPSFVNLTDLVSRKVGGEILFATDDWFAVAENLLKEDEPVWWEGEFTDFGKKMDGWETRRKRIPGHDWCIIKLGIPGVIRGVDANTRHFTGNYTPRISIQAACLTPDVEFPDRSSAMGSKANEEQFEEMRKLQTETWEEIIPRKSLRSGTEETCHNYFQVNSEKRWTHIRLNMYPDGGIGRLRIYGDAKPDWSQVNQNSLIDLVPHNHVEPLTKTMVKHSATTFILSSVSLFSLQRDRPAILEMGRNGVLEFTSRDWAVFRLGTKGIIERIEVDTNHFKGNFPDSCTVEGCVLTDQEEKYGQMPRTDKPHGDFDSFRWKTILPPAKLSAHKRHHYKKDALVNVGPVTHVRLTMKPDGGISRLRLWGRISSRL
nr:allantoicase-like [Lytechinus pictus]